MKRLIVQRRAMRDMTDARDDDRHEAPHMVADFAQTPGLELLHQACDIPSHLEP